MNHFRLMVKCITNMPSKRGMAEDVQMIGSLTATAHITDCDQGVAW